MKVLRADIEAAAGEEAIEAVVIGELPWRYDDGGDCLDARFIPGDARRGEVLTWAEAAPLLGYKYDTDYGAQDCPELFVWTASRVIYVHEYDGATSMRSVPRNPGTTP